MKSRTYYGEYTLKHWINLMLTNNIILPEYQRSFVWSEEDVKRLIKSLNDGQFVQPVTIAHYEDNKRSVNYILDGQQRLTSILLTFLGYIPNRDKFQAFTALAAGDDSAEEFDSHSETSKKSIGWTFKGLFEDDSFDNDPEKIKERLAKDSKYSELKIKLSRKLEEFLENTFLGFSYIVPDTSNEEEYQRFFSTLFRNINYLGMKLSAIESRRSLYYMNPDYKNYFEGLTLCNKDVLCDINIMENMQVCKLDFVRFLAILSQYKGLTDVYKIMVGYSAYSSRENYYADYVAYILKLEQSDRPDKFNSFSFDKVFPEKCWEKRFDTLREKVGSIKNEMNLKSEKDAFSSWIEADYWLMGLIYFVIMEDKSISFEDDLIKKIKEVIKSKRECPYYSKNPNRLGHLRERIQESINIYKEYAK